MNITVNPTPTPVSAPVPDQLKYIRTASGFVLWADMTMTYHAHMARLIREPVISAGFCRLELDGYFNCYGKSESLGISCHPTDSHELNRFMGILP
jgi:hypothetical protein